MRKIIVAGIRGQDGYYLASLLIQADFEVVGLTRDITQEYMTVENEREIRLIYTDYSVMSLLLILKEHNADVIVNLSGQSSVGKSWQMCEETIISQGINVSNFLRALILYGQDIPLINASSSEVFSTKDLPISETSSLAASNPYGCAQTLGHQMVDIYRTTYGIRCCNIVLFPHESIRRSPYFVFRKIVRSSVLIARGQMEYLKIGSLTVSRDWGHAREFMYAVLQMILKNCYIDITLCTGTIFSVEQVVSRCFDNLGLDWQSHTKIDQSLVRYKEALVVYGSYETAFTRIGWSPTLYQHSLIDYIQEQELSITCSP